MRRFLLVPALLIPTACSSESPPAKENAESEVTAPTTNTEGSSMTVEALRQHCKALLERPEKSVVDVEVQHLLVSFAGAGTRATRSKEDAEALAAQLFGQIQAGEDFDGLVRKHTDDSHPGIYAMTTGAGKSGVYPRKGMVSAFGDTGWRLEVGEVGVAGFNATASPFGWHIVKRTR